MVTEKNEIRWLLAATRMDLDIIILSEVSQTKRHILCIIYMGNLRNNVNELIYKTETDSQTQKTNAFLPKRKRRGERGII